MKDCKSIGERLYELRSAHGMSQEQLAETLDVSRQTISNWENDKVRIDLEKAAEICRLFDVSLDMFVSDKLTADSDLNGAKKNNWRGSKAHGRRTVVVICLSAIALAVAVVMFVLASTADASNESSTLIFTSRAVYIVIGVVMLIGAAVFGVLLAFKSK